MARKPKPPLKYAPIILTIEDADIVQMLIDMREENEMRAAIERGEMKAAASAKPRAKRCRRLKD